MMRTHKLWVLVMIAAALVAGGVGCKKDTAGADDKTYLTDESPNKPGESGKLPDPCLNKGAIGAQALLMKGDCGEVKPAICGNNVIEAGEDCDDGAKNGTAGDICDATCKKVAGGDGGGGDGKITVKIANTKPLPDGKLGEKYSAVLKASGVKSGAYTWSVTGLPEGFEATPAKNSLKITSTDIVSKGGTYKPVVTACEEGSDVNCVTCPETVCSFSITDRYRIEAYSLPYKSGDKAVCSSDSSSCSYALKASGEAQTAINAKGDTNNPYYVLQLRVKEGVAQKEMVSVGFADSDPAVGYAKDYGDLYYKWGMTVDGKPAGFLRWMDYVKPGFKLGDADRSGLFLMDFAEEKTHLVYPGRATILVGPQAMGQTFKDVEVTVTSAEGGTQTIRFDTITTPSPAAVQKEVSKKDPCYGKTGISIPGIDVGGGTIAADGTSGSESMFNVAGTLNQTLTTVFKIKGGVAPYKVYPVESDGPLSGAGGHANGETWGLVSQGDTFTITGGFHYADVTGDDKGDIREKVRVNVFDQCGSDASARVTFTTPIPKPVYVDDLKYVYVHATTEWTDETSSMNIQLLGPGDNVWAETGWFGVDGDDPTDISGMKPITNHACAPGTCKVDGIKKIRIKMHDPGSGWTMGADLDMTYSFTELDLVGDVWFIRSTANWEGEADEDDTDEYPYDINSFMHDGTKLMWQKRPHPNSTDQL